MEIKYAEPCQDFSIERWHGGERKSVEDTVITESSITIHVDGKEVASLACSPWRYDELAVGYLYSEGVIDGLDDVKSIEIDGDTVRVELTGASEARNNQTSLESEPLVLEPSAVTRLSGALETMSSLFERTGGVHIAALSDGSQIIANCEDIGRNNALTRLIGRCLFDGVSTKGKIVVFSGRVPEEVINRVIRAQFCMIISCSAPTSLSIKLAEENGVTLIGFARSNRFNVYACPERVAFKRTD